MNQPTVANMERLWETCKQFIADKEIECAETIYQTDRVVLGSYELIEDMCGIIGYVEHKED